MPLLHLINARVVTLDPTCPEAWGVEIAGGTIHRLLPDRTALVRRQGEPVEDLKGLTLMPSFADAHLHLRLWAHAGQSVDLGGCRCLDEAAARLANAAKDLAPGQWLRASRWYPNAWTDPTWPERTSLDRACPDAPALVETLDLHTCWANSLALEALGLSGDLSARPVSPGVATARHGNELLATGILQERAAFEALGRVPPPPGPLERRWLKSVCRRLYGLGVTAVGDMDGLEAAETLADLDEPLLIHASLREQDLAVAKDRRLRSGSLLGRNVSLGPLKLFADGSLGSRTAWMLAPYEGRPGDTGVGIYTRETLLELALRATGAGWPLAVHAIGDRACHTVLDVFRAVRTRHPKIGLRVEHAQLLAEGDISLFGELDVVASVQPSHLLDDIPAADALWGSRSRLAYAFRNIIDAGGRLAFGSDAPVGDPDPRAGLDAALNRRDRHGRPPGGWYPAQSLERASALWAATGEAQAACGLGGRAGRLTPGYRADLVAVRGDPWRTPPREQKVVRTWIGGVKVYERGANE